IDAEIECTNGLRSRVVGRDLAGATHVGTGRYSSTGYYGNEASEADYYVGASLEVIVPRLGAMERRTVTHAKWGQGEVVSATTENGERKVRVRFTSGEEKVLLERFLTFV